MIKIFATNQNGKIEFTEQELLDFVEEIKLECKVREWQRINSANPANPSVLPIIPFGPLLLIAPLSLMIL